MHSQLSSVPTTSPAVKIPAANTGTSVTSGNRSGATDPFRYTPRTINTSTFATPLALDLSLAQSYAHVQAHSGSAVESPPSSDDSQSQTLDDGASDELMNHWHRHDDDHLRLSSTNSYRMRRESDQTSPSSATSTTFPAADITPTAVFETIGSSSPDAIAPKIEELDEDGEVLMATELNDNHSMEQYSASAMVSLPRKRGRPRKHPLLMPGGQMKVAKGRSKTGCITCRRRKKKCDENKPACKMPVFYIAKFLPDNFETSRLTVGAIVLL